MRQLANLTRWHPSHFDLALLLFQKSQKGKPKPSKIASRQTALSGSVRPACTYRITKATSSPIANRATTASQQTISDMLA